MEVAHVDGAAYLDQQVPFQVPAKSVYLTAVVGIRCEDNANAVIQKENPSFGKTVSLVFCQCFSNIEGFP
jgi:hypothetical protein